MAHTSFDAFNARDLTPDQVAKSFVASRKYDELVQSNHSLLIGPRGSGKTTMLRMLSIEALRHWSGTDAQSYRDRLQYTGIFVPADITWGSMVEALGANIERKDCNDALGEIAFCTNVLLAVTHTLMIRLSDLGIDDLSRNYRKVPAGVDIDDYVRAVAEQWHLSLRSVSLRGIIEALRSRLGDLYSQAKWLNSQPQPTLALLYEQIPYAKLSVFPCVEYALHEFDALFNEGNARWALLFDEFEVVPIHIQVLVLEKLRATSSKIMYKVALAPCGPQTQLTLSAAVQPTAMDDLRRVELWYRDKKDSREFCRDLFRSRVAQHPTLQGIEPEQLLGRSEYFDEPIDSTRVDQYPDTVSWSDLWEKEFTALAKKDPTFQKYLDEQSIDPRHLDPRTSSEHGSVVRKIAPIVAFRKAYRTELGHKMGRKAFTKPYTGWDAIAAISEGNPRWLIGILAGLMRQYEDRKEMPIDPYHQWVEVSKAAGAFKEKLDVAALQQTNIKLTTRQPVYRTLERIGEQFRSALLVDDFSEDPPISFEVDDSTSEDLENCLRIALNFGGIVCYDRPDHVAGFSTLKGKRFRIAYILNSIFKLPLRSGKSRQLTTLLTLRSARSSQSPYEQGVLFSE